MIKKAVAHEHQPSAELMSKAGLQPPKGGGLRIETETLSTTL